MSSRRHQAARRREKREGTGSPHFREPAFLLVGKLHRPHGVKGEMIMSVLTDFPERLQPGITLYVGEDHRPFTLAGLRQHNKGALVHFIEHPSRESVQGLQNKGVYVTVEDRPPLPEGEYYQHQLLGLKVVSDKGELLGKLVEMIETGANDVMVVHQEDSKEILLPDIDSVVLDIDLEKGEITVHLLEGMLD